MSSTDAAVEAVVDAQLGTVKELDEDIFAYILGIVKDVDAHGCDPETLAETVSSSRENKADRQQTGKQADRPSTTKGTLLMRNIGMIAVCY